jgi:nitrogen regulatory protein PII-like uncharacterized protein
MCMFLAFTMKILSTIFFQDKGVGWLINFICDAQLITGLIFEYAFFIKKNIRRLLKDRP